MNDHPPPIGIFDSGVGGLSIASAVHKQIPEQPILYLADQRHVPYGPRPLDEIRALSTSISQYLIQQGARLIVVACNTASAAALLHLRSTFPQVPFVGMEPAIKPAAEGTITHKVGVLATPSTFQGTLYASLLDRYGEGITVYQHTCPGLVSEIEAGRIDGSETKRILTEALTPMVAAGVDHVVLGCTHYPFVLPNIRSITGESIQVIDPTPAVARQTERVLQSLGGTIEAVDLPDVRVQTTGSAAEIERFLEQFPDLFDRPVEVTNVVWKNGLINF
jgi:glutamate racemase